MNRRKSGTMLPGLFVLAGGASLWLNGSATIRFKTAAGQSAGLCDSATFPAEFDLTLTTGVASRFNLDPDVTGANLAYVRPFDRDHADTPSRVAAC